MRDLQTQHSDQQSRLHTHELGRLRGGQGKLKYRTAGLIRLWAASAVLGTGLLFMALALRKPESSFCRSMAILLLGFLLAAAVSVYRFSGWAGV
jgi:glycerol uptake facilitator-like aquaporin